MEVILPVAPEINVAQARLHSKTGQEETFLPGQEETFLPSTNLCKGQIDLERDLYGP